jgi:hypothetical protein
VYKLCLIEIGLYLAYHITYSSTVPSTVPVNYSYSNGTPGDAAASGSSLVLVLPRVAAGTRGQYILVHCTIQELVYDSTLCYLSLRAAEGGAGERRGGEAREREKGRQRPLGLLVVRQQGLG